MMRPLASRHDHVTKGRSIDARQIAAGPSRFANRAWRIAHCGRLGLV
jgi:hypothetical protein